MVNMLLNLSDKNRKKLLSKIKPEIKQHIFNSILTLTEILELDRFENHEDRVNLRAKYIAEYPDETHWDFAEHWAPNGYCKLQTVKISTNGEIAILKKGIIFLHSNLKVTKNKYNKFNINKKFYTFHRAIASTFIPKPNRLKEIGYDVLKVNHINKVRNDNRLYNLEWVTNSENTLHGLNRNDYNSNEIYKFKIIVDNGFLNREFIIDRKSSKEFGLNEGLIRTLSRRPERIFQGMTIEKISNDVIPTGIPSEILKLFKENKNYFNTKIRPRIGKILTGPYKNLEFSLIGKKQILKYFTPQGVSQASLGKHKTHKNCTFKKCSLKEAIPLQGILTDEIAKTLINLPE